MKKRYYVTLIENIETKKIYTYTENYPQPPNENKDGFSSTSNGFFLCFSVLLSFVSVLNSL